MRVLRPGGRIVGRPGRRRNRRSAHCSSLPPESRAEKAFDYPALGRRLAYGEDPRHRRARFTLHDPRFAAFDGLRRELEHRGSAGALGHLGAFDLEKAVVAVVVNGQRKARLDGFRGCPKFRGTSVAVR